MQDPMNVRCLIVDDTPTIHEDFQSILCRQDDAASGLNELEAALFEDVQTSQMRDQIRLDHAYQGEEAIAMVQRALDDGDPYQVAFVDVRMPPGLNGIDALARIWEVDPRLQAVICSAYSDRTWEDMMRDLGQSDGLLVLRKPFDAIEVLQLTHALSRKWHVTRELERQMRELEARVSERTLALARTNDELRREVSLRQQAQEQLEHAATHDALTGLPNRLLLRDRIDHAIQRSRRQRTSFALMLLDLDGFKAVNDTCGHPAGDDLLRLMAERLRSSVRESDTVARLGGDEFVLLLEDVDGPAGAAVVAERVLQTCGEPVTLGERVVRTPPSVGIALFPQDCGDAENLLKCADLAMYQAKRDRSGYGFFAAELVASSLAKMELRAELELALARDEFELWYQPLLDVRTGRISGMEALIRWQHPTQGLVPPMRFLAEAEQSGLLIPIGEWVLRTACRQLAEWREAGRDDLTVAVNVSARQLHSAAFPALVRECLEAWELPADRLELEITESSAIEDFDEALRVLERLDALGVRLVIDDFGSGYSSLARLRKMPIHALKIDRFFIQDIAEDPCNAAIVAAIIAMAHSMELDVVAEGIERIEQLTALRELKLDGAGTRRACDKAQGFLFARPLPAGAATSFLESTRGEADGADQASTEAA